MRVVIVTPYYHPVVGGVETHARHLARSLTRQGIDVWVLTKRIGPATPPHDCVDGVRVVRVPPEGPRRGAAKWRMIPHVITALARSRRGFDIIVCPDYRGVGVAALVMGRLLHRPVVFQAATPGALSCANWNETLARYGVAPDGALAGLIKAPVRALYGRADAYTCISREIEAETRAQARATARVAYVPHAVDLTAFMPPSADERRHARARLGLPQDANVVVFVGRLSREKGVVDLVHAWPFITCPDAVLLLAGPDMPGHPLDAGAAVRTAARAMPEGRIRLCGALDDVRPVLAAADLFVQPSHYEAFGISVIEAMAAGMPVVATGVGGMADYLIDGENAVLCPPGDPARLASAIASVLDDPNGAARLRANARRRVEEMFDENIIARRWLAVLEEVTGRAAASEASRLPTGLLRRVHRADRFRPEHDPRRHVGR